MWRFLVNLFAVLGFLGVLAAVGIGVLVWQAVVASARQEPPPLNTVLELDLRYGTPQGAPRGSLLPWGDREATTLSDAIAAIDRAAADHRVVALVAHIGDDTISFSAAQELRGAVERWQETGKPALAYSDGFGEFGPGNFSYYLASAFDEIWLRPLGPVGLTGLRMEVPFARDALESLEIEPDFSRRGPYKTFPEIFTGRTFSPAYREMLTSLTRDLYGQLVTGIAEGRGLSPSAVRTLIDDGPLLATEAESGGLIDALDTETAFRAAISERLGDTTTLDPNEYLAGTAEEQAAPAARVALIHAVGTITQGESQETPGIGTAMMGADTVVDAIEEAIADTDISAILLRVDSGGGQAVASAMIGAAVQRAVEAGKPVVVSMADTAGSGGYWIATHATAIVATPATLTGSIGVFGGKFATSALWEDLGIRWGAIQLGDNADIWSGLEPYSESGRERLDAVLDDIYGRFIARVAEGRNLDRESVEAIAEGRVWTGAQAVGLGLVDTLGGMADAMQTIRRELFLEEDAYVQIVVLPEQPGPLDMLLSLARGEPPISGQIALPPPIEEMAAVLAPLMTDGSYPVLAMPPMMMAR